MGLFQLSKTDKDKTYYERKCCKSAVADETLDKLIDSEVYKSKNLRGGLYDLTDEEIKIFLLNHFEYKMLKEVTANEIMVSQGDHTYNVRIVHQLKEQMVGNWYIILIVDESVDVPISH